MAFLVLPFSRASFFFAKEDESLLLYWSDPRGIYLNYKTWRVRRLGLEIQDDYEVLVYL
jgi:hypothetical protein